MRKLLFLLGCALLLLLASAVPALASYPVTGTTETAYVHIWKGVSPIPWVEFDSDGEMTIHWDGMAIPKRYDVCLTMDVWDGAPRGQVANFKNNLSAEFTMYGPDDRMPLDMGAEEARSHWNPAELWWVDSLFNKENGNYWVISWTYDLGPLASGTYRGVSTWSVKHKALSFMIPDPLPEGPLTSTHYDWRGTYSTPYAFTVGD